MKHLVELILAIIWLPMWMAGIVIAKGFWSTLAAITTGGLYSLYLVMELFLARISLI
jgi:hypothetical protein